MGSESACAGLERSWLTDTPNGNMLGEDKLRLGNSFGLLGFRLQG